jgi:hypothetical protein
MRSHWSSRNIFRSILTPPKSQDTTTFHSLLTAPRYPIDRERFLLSRLRMAYQDSIN